MKKSYIAFGLMDQQGALRFSSRSRAGGFVKPIPALYASEYGALCARLKLGEHLRVRKVRITVLEEHEV